MSIEEKIEKLTVAVERLADGVDRMAVRITWQDEAPAADEEPVKPEPESESIEPAKPMKPLKVKPAPVEDAKPMKPLKVKPAPVEDAMDPQPTFGMLDELRRVSIEMLKIDGKALREIYKRVGGSEKLSELPLHTHADVIAAIAAWRKEAGK